VQDIPNLGQCAGKALDSPARCVGLYGLAFSRITRACHHSFHPRESLQRGAVQGALSAV